MTERQHYITYIWESTHLSPDVTGVQLSAPHKNSGRRAIISMTADNKWLESLMEAVGR